MEPLQIKWYRIVLKNNNLSKCPKKIPLEFLGVNLMCHQKMNVLCIRIHWEIT